MPYPSTISVLPDPNPTDRLNSPSHSGLHQSENTAIEETQTFVGTISSVPGSLVYDIRSPLSNGGGHVQTANKGGTGQTNYQKGDLLVAQSSSVLTKLAVSSTIGEALLADPTQPVGMRWGNVVANKVVVKSSVSGIQNSTTETVMFSTSVLGSVLGTNNAIRFTGVLSNFSAAAGNGVSWFVNYGNNSVMTIDNVGNDALNLTQGMVEGLIIANGSDTSQKGFLRVYATNSESESSGDANVEIGKWMGTAYGTSSIASSATQNLIVTVKYNGSANPASSVKGEFFVVERIS